MYTIKSNKPNAIAWDAVANKVLCKFKDGVFKTLDSALAERLGELDYQVEEGEEMALTELSRQQIIQKRKEGEAVSSPGPADAPEETREGVLKRGRKPKYVAEEADSDDNS